MERKLRTYKYFVVLVVVVLALAAFMSAASPASAAGVCPAPGTGLAGAFNMTRDAKMLEIMILHVPDQGWAGMATAVGNTACP